MTVLVDNKKKKVSQTAHADEFKLTVFPEAGTLITLACPALVCAPTAASAYDVKVWPYRKTVVMIAMNPIVLCPDESNAQRHVPRKLIMEWGYQTLENNQR